MGIRHALNRQLSVSAWVGNGMSPTNACIVVLILLNLLLQVLETEPAVPLVTGRFYEVADWIFVALFTIEYAARVWVAGENARYQGLVGRLRYMATFFALIDLISILPAYLSLGAFNSSGVRTLRLLRVLRFARFGAFSVAFRTISQVVSLRAYELAISLLFMLGLLLAAATLMFLTEGDVQPEAFGSIPRALWWSVVTMTTVGYGDTYPVTVPGKMLAGLVAIMSVAIIAIPTAILSSAFIEVMQKRRARR